jgi:hypothetical protein
MSQQEADAAAFNLRGFQQEPRLQLGRSLRKLRGSARPRSLLPSRPQLAVLPLSIAEMFWWNSKVRGRFTPLLTMARGGKLGRVATNSGDGWDPVPDLIAESGLILSYLSYPPPSPFSLLYGKDLPSGHPGAVRSNCPVRTSKKKRSDLRCSVSHDCCCSLAAKRARCPPPSQPDTLPAPASAGRS